jgi:hypothetical protein
VTDPKGITVRYIGNDQRRRFCVQRGDSKFWAGDDGWSRILDKAVIYRTHKDAQVACSALQYAVYKGKPVRTFDVAVTITLVADDVESIGQEELTRFLAEFVRIGVENTSGDGPVDGSFVQLRMRLASLKETKPSRDRF